MAEEAELGLEPSVTEEEVRECEERAEDIARRLEGGGSDEVENLLALGKPPTNIWVKIGRGTHIPHTFYKCSTFR